MRFKEEGEEEWRRDTEKDGESWGETQMQKKKESEAVKTNVVDAVQPVTVMLHS